MAATAVGGCQDFALVHESVQQAVWAADERVYYFREIDGGGDELWSRSKDGPQRREAEPDPVGCEDPSLGFLFSLPDGRVGVGTECDTDQPVHLLTYDPKKRSYTPLATVVNDADDVAVSPDLRTGYVQRSNSLCDSILAFGDGATSPANVTVNGRTWRQDQGYSRVRECAETGYVQSPRLIGDGRTLVFLASGEPIGVSGQARPNPTTVQWRLCLWDLGTPASRVLDVALPGALGLGIAPDGRIAAVTLQQNGEKGRIVIVDLQTGAVRNLVTAVDPWDPSFSPDGTQLVYSQGLKRLAFAKVTPPAAL